MLEFHRIRTCPAGLQRCCLMEVYGVRASIDAVLAGDVEVGWFSCPVCSMRSPLDSSQQVGGGHRLCLTCAKVLGKDEYGHWNALARCKNCGTLTPKKSTVMVTGALLCDVCAIRIGKWTEASGE